MASMLIQHKVVDFEAWKKVFDSSLKFYVFPMVKFRIRFFSDASDPNQLTVINKWDSMANMQKFANSPELKAAMEKAGVVGKPNVFFLNEA